MKIGKAPGNDGLPMEFYKTFWPEIKIMLKQLYDECFEQGILNRSA